MLLILTLGGCASINIPNYIHDKHPYQQTYYASFDKVHNATIEALKDLGWAIEKETDPALFERTRETKNESRQQILIFTEIRQLLFFVGSRYARVNVYLQITADKATEVEIRYVTVTSMLFKSFYDYKNKKAVNRIFKRIEENLK